MYKRQQNQEFIFIYGRYICAMNEANKDSSDRNNEALPQGTRVFSIDLLKY